jgi:hypothetical protein
LEFKKTDLRLLFGPSETADDELLDLLFGDWSFVIACIFLPNIIIFVPFTTLMSLSVFESSFNKPVSETTKPTIRIAKTILCQQRNNISSTCVH